MSAHRLLVTLHKDVGPPDQLFKKIDLDQLHGVTVELISKRILIFEFEEGALSLVNIVRDRLLVNNTIVLHVESDAIVAPVDLDDDYTDYFPIDPLYPKQWGLTATSVPAVWKQGYTGKGQQIAIIDSGIDYTHPEFDGNGDPRINANLHPNTILKFVEPIMLSIRKNEHSKVAPGYNFIDGDDNTFDFHRHGTSVASQAVALGNNLGIIGVAPDARVAPYKVLDTNGNGSISNVIAALGRIIEAGNIRVVSISLVFPNKPLALSVITEEASDAGILVMAAVGNNNSHRILYPAGDDFVLSIGGFQPGMKRWIVDATLGTNWPCDILGPAAVMPTAQKWRGRYTDHQGTSLASPHVAGIVALCLEAWPEVPLQTLKSAILLSGGRATKDPYYGYGCVNAPKALAHILDCRSEVSTNDTEQYAELFKIQADLAQITDRLETWSIKYRPK